MLAYIVISNLLFDMKMFLISCKVVAFILSKPTSTVPKVKRLFQPIHTKNNWRLLLVVSIMHTMFKHGHQNGEGGYIMDDSS